MPGDCWSKRPKEIELTEAGLPKNSDRNFGSDLCEGGAE